MRLLFLLTLLLTIILFTQEAEALDYTEPSTETSFPFPTNLTIFETLGTIADKDNNTIGNFSHYLIGFEIFLENYSVEIDATFPIVEEYSYDPFGQRIKRGLYEN